MSEKNPINLNPGDSAVIVRHDNSDDADKDCDEETNVLPSICIIRAIFTQVSC